MNLTEKINTYLRGVEDIGLVSALDVEEFAGMSYTKLYRLLGKRGTTCKRLLVQERQRRCMEALERDLDITVDELTDICGYTYSDTMSRAFRSWTGKTVTQWKNDRWKLTKFRPSSL